MTSHNIKIVKGSDNSNAMLQLYELAELQISTGNWDLAIMPDLGTVQAKDRPAKRKVKLELDAEFLTVIPQE